jgi:dihydrofolate reductase
MPRTLTYYVGASIDGYIAGPHGEIDLFPVTQDLVDFIAAEFPETLPTHVRAALGIDPPNTRFDTIIQGRATYATALDLGMPSPYAHLRQYVVSGSIRHSPDPAVTMVAAAPATTVRELKNQDGAGIYLAGGGRLASQLLDEIDELIVKVYPVIIGVGVPMFATAQRPTQLTLTRTCALPGGTTILSYART